MKFNLDIKNKDKVEDWVRDNLGSEPRLHIERESVYYGGLSRTEYIVRKKGDKWILSIGLHGNKTFTLEVDDDVLSEEDAIMFVLKYSE